MPVPRLSSLNVLATLVRIVLIVAVLTCSLVWVSPAAQAAPKTDTSDAPVVDAWVSGHRLYVEAYGLPRNQAFVLRARRASEDKWTKLTKVQSNRWGIMNKSLRLPGELSRADRIQVCLKDKKTKQLYCVRAWRLE